MPVELELEAFGSTTVSSKVEIKQIKCVKFRLNEKCTVVTVKNENSLVIKITSQHYFASSLLRMYTKKDILVCHLTVVLEACGSKSWPMSVQFYCDSIIPIVNSMSLMLLTDTTSNHRRQFKTGIQQADVNIHRKPPLGKCIYSGRLATAKLHPA